MRNVRVDGKLDRDLRDLLLVLTLKRRHGLANHAHVEVKADPSNLARLLTAQEVTGTANFQVLQSHSHTGPEIGVSGNRR